MANRSGKPSTHELPKRSTIIREPAVVRRHARSSQISKVTSDNTIAAATMVFAALLAVMVANSFLYEPLHHIFMTPIGIKLGRFMLTMTIEAFVNDFLMAIFFLLVGIELKYEVTVGQLRRPRQAILPMLAAVGGVVVPALIFIACNWGGQQHGWAIPIATDIAFALGVMSLLGDKIAAETKVFFQTLAIADDILAIVVIALFYGHSPSIFWMAASGVAILMLWGLNRARIYTAKPYLIVGVLLWICMYKSGIHATLAGVILAFFLPAKSDIRLSALRDWLNGQACKLDDVYDDQSHVLGQHGFTKNAEKVEQVLHHVTPPLVRVEREIFVPVNFIILPLFAFVNAQVRLVGADFGALVGDPIALGAFFGAVLGKPVGIIFVTWILVKLGFSKLPKNVSWDQIIAVGMMGGMGFTMSILIAGMAFSDADKILAAKCAILLGSVVAGVAGIVFVRAHDALAHKAFTKTAED